MVYCHPTMGIMQSFTYDVDLYRSLWFEHRNQDTVRSRENSSYLPEMCLSYGSHGLKIYMHYTTIRESPLPTGQHVKSEKKPVLDTSIALNIRDWRPSAKPTSTAVLTVGPLTLHPCHQQAFRSTLLFWDMLP